GAGQTAVRGAGRTRDLRPAGQPLPEALPEGAMSRMRPVLMTAMMASLGLLPAALSHAVGAEAARPFAVVIVGGLVTATLLTLFVLPGMYSLLEPEEPAPLEVAASS